MYTENYLKDAALIVKATLSNQLARWAPSAYMRLTRETGRGEQNHSPELTAKYFASCVDEYREQLGLDEAQFHDYLRSKRVLEYGPGDILGVALLMYAYGAESVDCVDRFELLRDAPATTEVYRRLIEQLPDAPRQRAATAFREPGNPGSGFNPSAVRYLVRENGLSAAKGEYDLVISRAVLEHVNDLQGTIKDIASALRPSGVSVHQVDLRSHGLDRYQPFDFLTWPDPLYKLMFSSKGFPNRWRANAYRRLAEEANLRIERISATEKLTAEQVDLVRRHLAKSLGVVAPDELSWKAFWIVLRPSLSA